MTSEARQRLLEYPAPSPDINRSEILFTFCGNLVDLSRGGGNGVSSGGWGGPGAHNLTPDQCFSPRCNPTTQILPPHSCFRCQSEPRAREKPGNGLEDEKSGWNKALLSDPGVGWRVSGQRGTWSATKFVSASHPAEALCRAQLAAQLFGGVKKF